MNERVVAIFWWNVTCAQTHDRHTRDTQAHTHSQAQTCHGDNGHDQNWSIGVLSHVPDHPTILNSQPGSKLIAYPPSKVQGSGSGARFQSTGLMECGASTSPLTDNPLADTPRGPLARARATASPV